MPRTRSIRSFASTTNLDENRIASSSMSHSHAEKTAAPSGDPLAAVSGSSSALTVFLVFLTAAAGTLAFLSAQSAEPLVLTLMGLLAMLGVFFLFGLAAGHIRISRTPHRPWTCQLRSPISWNAAAF